MFPTCHHIFTLLVLPRDHLKFNAGVPHPVVSAVRNKHLFSHGYLKSVCVLQRHPNVQSAAVNFILSSWLRAALPYYFSYMLFLVFCHIYVIKAYIKQLPIIKPVSVQLSQMIHFKLIFPLMFLDDILNTGISRTQPNQLFQSMYKEQLIRRKMVRRDSNSLFQIEGEIKDCNKASKR